MKSLQESLFDSDVVQKDPIDFSWIKEKGDRSRAYVFDTILAIMTTPNFEQLEEWMQEEYYEHKLAYDYILEALYDAFKKQHFHSWFVITENDFEEAGEEMSDEQIELYNQELMQFFAKATETDTMGYFLVKHGKLDALIVDTIKDVEMWNNCLNSCKDWAVCYWSDYGPVVSFYGCPKNLDPIVKKALYY